ncbi:MAG: hypothetical protein JWM19_5868, partial [Actinomycetia bacterium]|nr:hypothetical protein [Actinomycetes bacterium]
MTAGLASGTWDRGVELEFAGGNGGGRVRLAECSGVRFENAVPARSFRWSRGQGPRDAEAFDVTAPLAGVEVGLPGQVVGRARGRVAAVPVAVVTGQLVVALLDRGTAAGKVAGHPERHAIDLADRLAAADGVGAGGEGDAEGGGEVGRRRHQAVRFHLGDAHAARGGASVLPRERRSAGAAAAVISVAGLPPHRVPGGTRSPFMRKESVSRTDPSPMVVP